MGLQDSDLKKSKYPRPKTKLRDSDLKKNKAPWPRLDPQPASTSSTRVHVPTQENPVRFESRDEPENILQGLNALAGGVVSGAFDLKRDETQSPLGQWATQYEDMPVHTVGDIGGLFIPYAGAAKGVGAVSRLPRIARMAQKAPGLLRTAARGAGVGAGGSALTQGGKWLVGEDPEWSDVPKEAAMFGAMDVGLGAASKGLRRLWNVTKRGERWTQESGILDVGYTPKSRRESKIFKEGQRRVRQRATRRKAAEYDTREWVNQNRKKLTPQEREDLIFYLQETPNPFTGDKNQTEILSRLSPEALEMVPKLRTRFNEARRRINATGLADEMGYLENYVTQFWRGSKKDKKRAIRYLREQNPFAKERSLESYAEGIEKLGLKPKHRDVFSIVEDYEKIANRVVENNRLLQGLKAIRTPEGKHAIIRREVFRKAKGGKKKTSNIPDNYVELDSPALSKAMDGRGRSVWVHEDLEKPLRAVFDQPFGGKVAGAMTTINAVSKKMLLSASLFHHLALTESAVYSGLNPAKYRRGLKLLEDKSIRNEMINAGLDVSAPSDVHRSILEHGLRRVAERTKDVPVINKAAAGVARANQMWDSALWDHYHRGLKAYAFYEKLAQQTKKHPNASPPEVTEIREAVAKHVNNAFGGQNWETLLKSPKWRQIAHWAFLSPDWTLSNMKIATSALKTSRGGIGAGVEGSLGRRYAVGAAFTFFSLSNVLNKALSGRWMWENEDGHKFDIATGQRDDKGRMKYIKLSKQVREPFRWLVNPIHEAGVKASPIAHMVSEQMTGKRLGGWQTDINSRESLLESAPDRIKTLGEHFIPISLQSNNVGWSLPTSKGEVPWWRKD